MSVTSLFRVPRFLSIATLSTTLLVAGCEQAKSSNPLSPMIAGPIVGVDISLPRGLEPGTGAKIEDKNQPITLLIENPASNSPRPFTLLLQIAADTQFTNLVFTRSGITPGSDGRTSFVLPDKLAHGRAYYWRVRAEDGANSSDWSASVAFEVLTPIVIGTPEPRSPVGNVRVTSRQPTLVAGNGASSGPHGALYYLFELSTTDTFAGNLSASVEVPQNPSGETTLAIPTPLPYNTPLFWRVRVSDGQNTGAWSSTQAFLTPLAPVVAPPPGPVTPVPTGGWPDNGPDVVAYVAATYPERLQPTNTIEERHHNTEFLRDKVIEVGLCGGMELALNLKRGGPEISIDFIAHRNNGTWTGIDFAAASKVYTATMSLYWGDYGPESGPVPTPYPRTPNCSR